MNITEDEIYSRKGENLIKELSTKQIEINNFNEKAKNWNKNIPKKNYEIALNIIEKFNIKKGNSVLDVACGTGIIFSILKDIELSKYIGVDLAEKMVDEFKNSYPEADVRQADFESRILFENSFDYIIIYNSIPHFNDLNIVFKNAYNNLKKGGTFIIAHSKTRKGLREHHKSIGYISDKKEPIPEDKTLFKLCKEYKFKNVNIEDLDFFCFYCQRE